MTRYAGKGRFQCCMLPGTPAWPAHPVSASSTSMPCSSLEAGLNAAFMIVFSDARSSIDDRIARNGTHEEPSGRSSPAAEARRSAATQHAVDHGSVVPHLVRKGGFGRADSLQLAELVRLELHVQRVEVFLELRRCARPDDWKYLGPSATHPGQRDLGRGDPACASNGQDYRHDSIGALAQKSSQPVAARRVRSATVEFAGQHSERER